ncbi:hypothetical protein [Terricaulis sp.]|uniref:hypothetical protein n=1 Tax=Terricaulis sp. TaxID=2768686 RepID=UPI00378328EC
MNPRRRRLLNPHRLARIILWARTMLAWLASVLFADAKPASRRRIRQRYGFAGLDWAARLVRGLAIIRAAEITGIRPVPRPQLRNAARPGFRRRITRGGIGRALAGARFRKALKARDPQQRLQLLLAAATDIDAFARRYLVRRLLRRLTKVCAVLMRAPPADALSSLAMPAPCAADSS